MLSALTLALPLLSSLLFTNPTAARTADLVTHFNEDCTGAIYVCANAPQDACCVQSGHPYYKSNSCNGCHPSDYNTVYKHKGSLACGSLCNLSSGGRCAACSIPLGGHAWFIHNNSKRQARAIAAAAGGKAGANAAREAVAAPACTTTIAPNMFSKDQVTWFKINHGVPQHVTDRLLAWGADGNSTSVDDLDDEVMQYEVPGLDGYV